MFKSMHEVLKETKGESFYIDHFIIGAENTKAKRENIYPGKYTRLVQRNEGFSRFFE